MSLANGGEGEALPLASVPLTGIGLACGTEKGSFVAACAEVAIDRENNRIRVTRVSQVFECGKIVNPDNLLSQVQGAIMMGIGPALREEIRFENGKITNAAFSKYRVPRIDDMPQLDVHLLDRPDLPIRRRRRNADRRRRAGHRQRRLARHRQTHSRNADQALD